MLSLRSFLLKSNLKLTSFVLLDLRRYVVFFVNLLCYNYDFNRNDAQSSFKGKITSSLELCLVFTCFPLKKKYDTIHVTFITHTSFRIFCVVEKNRVFSNRICDKTCKNVFFGLVLLS